MGLTVRVRLRGSLAPLFVLAIALSQSDVMAQNDPCEIGPTSCERPPNSRFFQMAVWTYEDPGPNWQSTLEYADLPIFGEGNAQPPGRSIMRATTWYGPTPFAMEGVPSPDWSRVLAVVIDEPYTSALPDGEDGEIPTNPCENSTRQGIVDDTRLQLMSSAVAVHTIAPKTRLWVNFHRYEVDWMRDPVCPQHLNDPAIDVVSLDNYDVFVSSLRDEYDWFISSIPEQQIALVPGIFYEDDWSFATKALAQINLQWYFDYADQLNQQCNIGLGRVGRTGNYDGCRVWIVAGWSAIPQYREYLGLLHPDVAALSGAWRSQLAKVRRFGPRALSPGELKVLELLED